MAKLKTITRRKSRLEMLKKLAEMLAEQLEICEEKSFASIAKQYRETIAEIETIENMEVEGDELADIITNREENGKSGAVRKNRSGTL